MSGRVASIFAGLFVVLGACGATALPPGARTTVTTSATLGAPSSLPSSVVRELATAIRRVKPTASRVVPPTQTTTPSPPPMPSAGAGPVNRVALKFNAARAYEDVRAQMQWVPRDTGTPGWKQTGDYIVAQLRSAGWQVREQRFTYRGQEVRNITGARGQGPTIILGAHYDARRFADYDPDPQKRQQPVPAANDGASGVAVLLELARALRAEDLKHEVQLAFFDAEDNGEIDGWEWGVGSRYMAEHLAKPPAAVVVLDMIGDADLRIPYEMNSTPGLRESIWKVASALGFAQFVAEPGYSMIDDHTAFLEQGYPAVDVIDFDYPPWHTTADTLDKVSSASLEAIGMTVEAWLRGGATQ